jgi:predicted nucleic acid-binding protein
MNNVVDATVLVAALTDSGPAGVWSEEILGEGHLVAPHVTLVEAANILRRLERTKQLSAIEAASAHDDLLHMDILLLPYEPFAARVWELRLNVATYDAWHVAIAEAYELPLATLDKRLGRTSGVHCRFRLPG